MSHDPSRQFFMEFDQASNLSFQPLVGPLTPEPNKSLADVVHKVTRCERQISGVQDHANCPNPAMYKIVLSKLVTYWDAEEEVEYLCEHHANVYLHENDVSRSELVYDGWMVAL